MQYNANEVNDSTQFSSTKEELDIEWLDITLTKLHELKDILSSVQAQSRKDSLS